MNKEQAFKNLSLPADADNETIRMRFAARYTLSDAQYDHTLTDGMKAVHEQHLRDLEQAYKVATDNPVIADMGALLSLGKGYVEENGASIGGNDTISIDEALAFFALYPHDSPVLAEQRYTQYVTELEEAMEQVGLEASKEPYRQEMARAEIHLNVVINYLLASQMLASQQEEIAETAGEQESMSEPEREEIAEPAYAAPPASKTFKKPKFAIIAAAAIALLAIGIWIGKGSGTDGDNNGKPDSSAHVHMEKEITQRSASNPQSSTAQPEIAETPTAVSQGTEVSAATRAESRSHTEIIQAALEVYAPTYHGRIIGSAHIEAKKEGEHWIIPLRDIADINEQGQFVSKSDRPGFLFDGNQRKKTTENFKLTTAPRLTKKLVMDAIHALVSPSGSSQSATLSTTPSADPVTETAKKEVVPTQTGSIPSAAPKKDTVESASSKSTVGEKATSKRETAGKEEQPATEPPAAKPDAASKANTSKDTTAKP